jgi:hypothetical protein
MALDMQDVGAVLLGAGADDEVREADPVLAARREFMLGAFGCVHGLSVDTQIAKQRERCLLLHIVRGGSRAEEDFQTREGAIYLTQARREDIAIYAPA